MKAQNSVGFSHFKTSYIEAIQIIFLWITRKGVGAVFLFKVWDELKCEKCIISTR